MIDQPKSQLDQELERAKRGHPDALMADGTSAERFLSLYSFGGYEDFFSSDLTDEMLKSNLGQLPDPTLFVLSGNDEYVPQHVDKAHLLNRFVAASGQAASSRSSILAAADHAIKDQSQEAFIDLVIAFLSDVDRRS